MKARMSVMTTHHAMDDPAMSVPGQVGSALRTAPAATEGMVRNADPTQPLLTVIVPVYNEARTVEELLERVLAGPYPGKQVIVVDDGSTDGTAQVLARWS